MKLSVAVALHMAILAIAAPTALNVKRADSEDVGGDLSSKVALESLKSVAHMMAMNDDDNTNKDTEGADDADDADLGTNVPPTMTPNESMNFPGPNDQVGKPTPVSEGEGEPEGVATPSPSSAASPSASLSASSSASSSAPPSSSSTASTTQSEHEETDPEQGTASPSPSPAPKPTNPTNPLEGLPIVGGLAGGLFDNI